MRNIYKKLWNIITTAIVVVTVGSAIFLLGSRLLNFRVFNVISNSMYPTYNVGDLIYVKGVDVNTISVGDPITFVLDEKLTVATHRVVRIDKEKSHFYTKGDANELEDAAPVHFNNVIGVPRFSIPILGYVSDFIQRPPGMYITIALGLIMLTIAFLPDLLNKKTE